MAGLFLHQEAQSPDSYRVVREDSDNSVVGARNYGRKMDRLNPPQAVKVKTGR